MSLIRTNFWIFLLVSLTASPVFGACDYMSRIRKFLPVSAISETQFKKGAKFSSSSDELAKRVGGFLSGENLYLFSDGTYIYTEWADIMSETIYDKGSWIFSKGCIFLKSGPEITWQTRNPKTLVALRRNSVVGEVFLLGVGRNLSYFESHANNDPEFMLLITAWKRVETLVGNSKEVKLMSKSWNPSFFEKNR